MKKANLLKRVLSIVLVGALVVGSMPSAKVQAASANRKAGKAFARALNTGKITFNDDSQYCLCDMNRDGVKELIIEEDSSHYVIWKYSNGKVSKLLDFYAEYVLSYNKKTNTFWETGDGDGGWANSYKWKGKKLVPSKTSYNISSVEAKGKNKWKWVATKTVNGKTTKISKKKYDSIQKNIEKNNAMKMKSISKSKLILKLQNKKIYTPKDFHLSNDTFTYRGIQIVGLTSKYIKYKKVKLQGTEETVWLPYDKHTYKMKYSNKIDIFLLADCGYDEGKWVKTYSGISYKKLKRCFNKGIKNYVLIKNKKGKVTKMVELFVS